VSLHLPKLHAIQDVIWLPEFDFLVFKAVYGEASDVFPSVIGLRHGGRIGILHHEDTKRSEATYPYSTRDTILASSSLLDTLELRADWISRYYIGMLLKSPMVTPRLLARLVPRCFASNCDVPATVEAAVRIRDVDALTTLSFMRLHSGASTLKSPLPRQGLQRLSSTILAERATPPATLFALALASNDYPADSMLAAKLLAHPRTNQDLATLTVLTDARPWIADRVLRRVPPAARPAFAPVLGRTTEWPPPREREALFALLRDPILGQDRAVLTVLANLPPETAWAAVAEAARRLPDSVFRRSDYYPEPPPLR
jgi:hypothetical protein